MQTRSWRTRGHRLTSAVFDARTDEIAIDVPSRAEMTPINVDSAVGILKREPAANPGGSFDNGAEDNIINATFGISFGSITFGNVAQPGLAEQQMLGDLTIIGSLQGGGDLDDVDFDLHCCT